MCREDSKRWNSSGFCLRFRGKAPSAFRVSIQDSKRVLNTLRGVERGRRALTVQSLFDLLFACDFISSYTLLYQ